MTRCFVAALVTFLAIPAHADIYTYKCRFKGKALVLRIDDVKQTLNWRGKDYKIERELTPDECGKFGWRAERAGDPLDFCTATQGYADFQEGGKDIECDLSR